MKKKNNTNSLFNRIKNNQLDILIGTQMISKGFNFPKLNCIVVIDADFSGRGYDLRTTEKNIQLYHQLSGRAGRFSSDSLIVYQTLSPENITLNELIKNDPDEILKKELILRKKNFFQNCINYKEILPKNNWFKNFEKSWFPSEESALKELRNFIKNRIMYYSDSRNFPNILGTSKLSPFIKHGQIHVETIWTECENIKNNKTGITKFLAEIGWREFNHTLINHFPHMLKSNY